MINFNLLKTLNILYIQSNEDIKKDFLVMIDGLFNNVICANNAKEGISTFVENKEENILIDVVISDIDMPDINGIEMIKTIKNEDLNIPIILITNNTQSEILLEAIKYKVTDYLPISVRKKEFMLSIQKACQLRYREKFNKELEGNLEELICVINDVALVSKTDLNGKITFVNKYYCDTTGYSNNELLGQSHDFTEELWDKIKQGKVWEGKKRSVTKNQKVFFEYLNVIPIFNPLNNSIKEYMWISFISTEEEIEQNEFKKKVAQNMDSSRRINTEAREEIDSLFKTLERRKSNEFIKYNLTQEKRKAIIFQKNISSYLNRISLKEKELLELINNEKKYEDNYDSLDKFENQDIDYLTEELDNQIMILEELQTKKEDEDKLLLK